MALTSSGAASINVSIDELVIDGVAPGDPRVAQAIEEAVARALSATPAIRPGVADPATIGAAAGGAIATTTTGSL